MVAILILLTQLSWLYGIRLILFYCVIIYTRPGGTFAVGSWCCDVMRIATESIPSNFSIYFGATRYCLFVFLTSLQKLVQRKRIKRTSSTNAPAPSPMTNPQRSTSNGLELSVGFSLYYMHCISAFKKIWKCTLVVNAFALEKPAMDNGLIAASDPPATIISASIVVSKSIEIVEFIGNHSGTSITNKAISIPNAVCSSCTCGRTGMIRPLNG